MVRWTLGLGVMAVLWMAPAAPAGPLEGSGSKPHKCTETYEGSSYGSVSEQQCDSNVTIRHITLLTEDCWDYRLTWYGQEEHYWRCRRTIGPLSDSCRGSTSPWFAPDRFCATEAEAGSAQLTCTWSDAGSRCLLVQGPRSFTICENDCPPRPYTDPLADL